MVLLEMEDEPTLVCTSNGYVLMTIPFRTDQSSYHQSSLLDRHMEKTELHVLYLHCDKKRFF